MGSSSALRRTWSGSSSTLMPAFRCTSRPLRHRTCRSYRSCCDGWPATAIAFLSWWTSGCARWCRSTRRYSTSCWPDAGLTSHRPTPLLIVCARPLYHCWKNAAAADRIHQQEAAVGSRGRFPSLCRSPRSRRLLRHKKQTSVQSSLRKNVCLRGMLRHRFGLPLDLGRGRTAGGFASMSKSTPGWLAGVIVRHLD